MLITSEAARYHAGPALLSLFDHYCNSMNDGIELQNFQHMCQAMGLVPAPLTYSQVYVLLRHGCAAIEMPSNLPMSHDSVSQVRSQFRLISSANEAEGSSGITLTYTGLVRFFSGAVSDIACPTDSPVLRGHRFCAFVSAPNWHSEMPLTHPLRTKSWQNCFGMEQTR